MNPSHSQYFEDFDKLNVDLTRERIWSDMDLVFGILSNSIIIFWSFQKKYDKNSITNLLNPSSLQSPLFMLIICLPLPARVQDPIQARQN